MDRGAIHQSNPVDHIKKEVIIAFGYQTTDDFGGLFLKHDS
jgi:hypothetical protein